MEIILASASPRRAQLLSQVGADFRVVVSEVEETIVPGLPPVELVVELAKQKAQAVAQGLGAGLVIGADTLVIADGRVLGKPASAAEAADMLRQLSGKNHTVATGVAVVKADTGELVAGVETTEVWFRELSEAEISAYVASGEPLDKAGAYGIQEKGALLVCRLDGCYFNVVGLPLVKLLELLRHFDVDLLERRRWTFATV